MRKILAIVGVLALAACTHKPEPTLCPAPPGELLVAPMPLLKLNETQAMTLDELITAWLNDTETHRLMLLRFGRLQDWGTEQCAWPGKVSAATD